MRDEEQRDDGGTVLKKGRKRSGSCRRRRKGKRGIGEDGKSGKDGEDNVLQNDPLVFPSIGVGQVKSKQVIRSTGMDLQKQRWTYGVKRKEYWYCGRKSASRQLHLKARKRKKYQ